MINIGDMVVVKGRDWMHKNGMDKYIGSEGIITAIVPGNECCVKFDSGESLWYVEDSLEKKIGITPVHEDFETCTCMNCLKNIDDGDKFVYTIRDLGYGSIFDTFNSKIILCKKCYIDSNIIWSDEVVEGNYHQSLRYEKEIGEYIDGWPLAGQELFWNRLSSEYYKFSPQEWISDQLED